ncbi:32842_t:CDS:2, partial [Racocetra persica]
WKEFGYSALTDYISQAGKFGGTFIWTSNSPTSNSVFATNRNKSWKVLTYISFMDKSLLFVQANDSWYNLLPTCIPEKLKAEEAGEILRVIEESGMGKRKKEERVVKKRSSRIKEVKAKLKKYGLKTEPISERDLERWDKIEKGKKKVKENKLPAIEEKDLDQENQEPEEEKLTPKRNKKRK